MSRRADNSSGGFSIVELAMSIVIGGVIISVLALSLKTGKNASTSLHAGLDLSESTRSCLRRISEELRTAGQKGEDLNGNATLDTGEDTNGNGRLDADWAVTANSITFNRLIGAGIYSLPIKYYLSGSKVLREEWTDTSGKKMTVTVAKNVAEFTVTATGRKVTFQMTLSKTNSSGQTFSEKQTMPVSLRN